MIKALVFTPSALFRLSNFEISNDWFGSYQVPPSCAEIKRVEVNECIYFIEPLLERDDVPLIVINISGTNPVFQAGQSNIYALERIITVARSFFTNSVKIPVAWREYHDKSLLSIYAKNRQKGDCSATINLTGQRQLSWPVDLIGFDTANRRMRGVGQTNHRSTNQVIYDVPKGQHPRGGSR